MHKCFCQKFLLVFKNIIALCLSVETTYCPSYVWQGKALKKKLDVKLPGAWSHTFTHSLLRMALRLREVSLTQSGSPCWTEPTGRLQPSVSHLHTICIVLTRKYILCLPCCSLIKVTFRNKAKDLEYCVAYKMYSLYFIDHEILKLWNLVNLEEFCLEAWFKCEVSNSDSYWDSAKPYS